MSWLIPWRIKNHSNNIWSLHRLVFFLRDGPILAFANPYIDSLQILTNQIREFNAKFILDKSGLRLDRVLQFTLKWLSTLLLKDVVGSRSSNYLPNKEIINIRNNNNERFLKYALLYFFERANLTRANFCRATVYNDNMFQSHHFDTLLYQILIKDVHLFEDQIQMNINAFFLFNDKGRARHPLVNSRKNYERVANLLY